MPEPIKPGRLVDHFQVLRLLGRGSTGEVFLARDTHLGRRVALKMVHPERLGDEASRARFLGEARITARFNHPHIVTIYSVGEHQGYPYLALEYLEGETLRQRMAQGQVGQRAALRLGLAIAEALREAHRHGVLHRDLKPENVLLPRDGRLRVLDFGLARMSVERGPAPGVHGEEELLGDAALPRARANRGLRGTPAYMAPEQWDEQQGTQATDVWALGLILAELVTGRHPFAGLGFSDLRRFASSPEPMTSVGDSHQTLPRGLAPLIDSCLRKDPRDRPSADAVATSLSELLHGDRHPLSADESPFRGLLPFTEDDAHRFFGREAEIASFVERLRTEPLLPVVGPSGTGKSSFVHAGVVPRLREEGRWLVLRMRPGRHPFRTLAARLLEEESAHAEVKSTEADRALSLAEDARPDAARTAPPLHSAAPEDAKRQGLLAAELRESPSRLALRLGWLAKAAEAQVLLFVDQLEELYTLAEDPASGVAFMHAVCSAADDPQGPVRVVYTLRDDFLGRVAGLTGVHAALGQVTVLRRLGPEALTAILRKPLEATSYRYEDPDLVVEMVAEVLGTEAALPLLQFAAQRLWEERDRSRRLLTRAAFRAGGGVAGALAQHADSVLGGLSPGQERIARILFLRLVHPDATRRVLTRGELLDGLDEAATTVLERFTAARAITVRKGPQGTELELVHDSLVQSWGRLARWLEESREEGVFLAEVGQAATLWARRGRPADEVWQGPALFEALGRAGRCAVLPTEVRDFLDAGRERERRRRRRRAMALATAFVLLTVVAGAAIAVSLIMHRQEQEASRQKQLAQSRRREAVQQRAAVLLEGARSALRRDALLGARAKLRSALEVGDSPLARALWWRLQKSRLRWRKRVSSAVYDVAYAPDGKQIAAACADRAVYLIQVATQTVRILRGHTDQVTSVAFASDGRYLASGSWNGEVRLWDLRAGTSRLFTGHRGSVDELSFSPDSRLLASAGDDQIVRVWRVSDGTLEHRLRGHRGVVWGLRFGPRGRLLASSSADQTIRLWRLPSGRALKVLRGHRGPVNAVGFGPRGRLLATAGSDGTVRIWPLGGDSKPRRLFGHRAAVHSVTFSPDGALLASASEDRTVRIWRVATGRSLAVLRGHRQVVWGVQFGPRGRFLASGGWDNTVALWRVAPDEPPRSPGGHGKAVSSVVFAPDGRRLASAGEDGTVRLWETRTGRVLQVLRGHTGGVLGVDISPNGRLLASAGSDGAVRLWRLAGGSSHELRGHRGPVIQVRFSPDGRLLASASKDRTVRLWRLPALTSRRLVGHRATVASLRFHPGGRLLASASWDRTIRLWKLPAGSSRVLLGHHGAIGGLSFSRDGRTLASASWDRTVRLWDLRSGTSRQVVRLPGRAYQLELHPDGERLGVPCSDGTGRILNLRTRTHEQILLRGHRDEVDVLTFDPTGRLAATSSDDGTVRLWDADTGKPIWRAPLFRSTTLDLYTHLGWERLGPHPPPRSRPSADIGAQRWRRAVERRARLADETDDGRQLCLATSEGVLEMWDEGTDRRLLRQPLAKIRTVLAVPRGCVALAAGSVTLHRPSAPTLLLAKGATAIAWDRGELLVASGRHVRVFGAAGKTRARTYNADVGVTAIGRTRDWLLLGYRDGNIELVPLRPALRAPRFGFEGAPSSPVVRIIAGPPGTLVAGHANGVVGLWSLHNGFRLHQEQLHGPVIHLLIRGGVLYAATELGQHLTWDLSAFSFDYCSLLRRVWRDVPVVWREGLPSLQAPPPRHRCAVRGQVEVARGHPNRETGTARIPATAMGGARRGAR